jgi:Spy/CpxP family protein refolding chaperone
MFRTSLCLCSVLALVSWSAGAQSQSPYVGQEYREIKALSPQEISDYLSGRGMGLAKAAELNGYPGPAHVLELATELNLTADQKIKTEALFRSMQARAIDLGKELVEEERSLDRLFASHSVTPEALGNSLARIGKLQGQVRQTHLDAHLKLTALLSPEQIKQYNRLRGYEPTQGNENHEQRRH